MKAVVIYESMYGNTHLIAEAIGAGLRGDAAAEVAVVPVGDAGDALLAACDLVVVGGPTHAHGLPRESTRTAAAEATQKPDSDLTLDDDAEGPGLREWFTAVGALPKMAAAFDTRIDAPAVLTGRASKGIAKRLRERGCDVVVPPESFLVTRQSHLVEREVAHAEEWGARIARAGAFAG
ncbi:MAG TPA: flavodoxin domain-containing protein [Acidimicrobiia bacterium]|nr:flavodoxin domain-containing protein [Acidimicrobiia bacterium]